MPSGLSGTLGPDEECYEGSLCQLIFRLLVLIYINIFEVASYSIEAVIDG